MIFFACRCAWTMRSRGSSARGSITPAGRTRYLALYQDVKGRQRSAGTYATATQAEKAWVKAEDRMSEGRLGDASRVRQKLARYVEDTWLPHHQMEARTRENYTYYLNRHILPAFGTMRLIENLPGDVRSWVTDLQTQGVSVSVTAPATPSSQPCSPRR